MTKKIITLLAVLLIIAGGSIYLIANKSTAKPALSNIKKNNVIKGTPSKPTQHSASPSTSNSNPTESIGTISTSSTTPSISSPPPASKWTTSSTGAITLQQPYENETIQSGATLSGTVNSSITAVDYILTDNSVGQIAQGSLDVVNGKFSGTLSFVNHSTKGTLQVYSPNPNNGAEENIINIDVNYN